MARTIAKDYDHKRARILKSAARVFAREGFDRASMSQLARECGISKANIYHYYDSKDAILFDMLDSYLRQLRDLICGLDLQNLSPAERLRRVVHEILMAYHGVDDEHRVQTSGMSALPEDQQKLLRGYQRDMVEFLSEIIADAAPETFREDATKLRATTMSVFGMLNWFYMWNAGADAEARGDYAALVSDLTLSGVAGL
ncbi:TetR family transcriptional regulator [Ruegeria sp. ANG-R]|uniref:TetR/AcrR family transcriptional regulator n=1 Tax=Ruegeria sp. ANG-R TaxID=1577903 RepID=UPI00057F8EFB|nr:TetR/AcrR family transcriptional regulator [Ruegeria sp. ANG-R]KIC38182.1 TetR family transcriptional regulator [Ruegeria sp. ANG-R]